VAHVEVIGEPWRRLKSSPSRPEFTPLDLLLHRRFRSEAPGRVERTIDLNRGICDHAFLPVGTKVTVEIPDPPIGTATRLIDL
jgi:hypothetical protein